MQTIPQIACVLMNIPEQDGTDYMKLIGSKVGE